MWSRGWTTTDALPAVVGLVARIGGRRAVRADGPRRAVGACRGADVDDEARPGPVRAPARRGAAPHRRARPQPDQRQHRAPGDRPRRRAGESGRDLARGRHRSDVQGASVPVAAAPLPRPRHRAHPVRLVAGHRAVRRARPELAPEARLDAACAAYIRRRSPTWSKPPRTRRARRSWTPSAATRSSRPTCSRSSTTSTRSSSCASAQTNRWPRCWGGWRATTRPTCCSRSSRSAGSRCSTCCRRPSSARSWACWATTRRPRAG